MREVLEPKERNGKWYVDYPTISPDGKASKIVIEGDTERDVFKKIQSEDAAQASRVAAQANIEKESSIFIAKHRFDFLPCTGNAKLMSECLQQIGLTWTAANLETVFDIIKDTLAKPQKPEVVEVEVAPPPPAPIVVPWKTPLTYQDVLDMPKDEYKGYLMNKDKVLKAEFERQLEEIGIGVARR